MGNAMSLLGCPYALYYDSTIRPVLFNDLSLLFPKNTLKQGMTDTVSVSVSVDISVSADISVLPIRKMR